MAAIMSTIDSQLIQASATLLKDLYINYINPSMAQGEKAEKTLPKLSLWVTGIFSALVFVAALNPPDMIIWLNLLSLRRHASGILMATGVRTLLEKCLRNQWFLRWWLVWFLISHSVPSNRTWAGYTLLCQSTLGLIAFIIGSKLKPDPFHKPFNCTTYYSNHQQTSHDWSKSLQGAAHLLNFASNLKLT